MPTKINSPLKSKLRTLWLHTGQTKPDLFIAIFISLGTIWVLHFLQLAINRVTLWLKHNALLSGGKLLAKMRGTKLANCLASVLNSLLCAGCDYHKQHHLYKILWQPDCRIKKLPLSATHQTMNFEPHR